MDQFKKKLVFEISVAFIIITTLFVGIFFFSGTISDYSEQIGALRKKNADHAKSIATLATLRSQYSSVVKQDLQILNNAVPIKDQLINLPKEFQLLASQYGLSSSFSFVGENPSSPASLGSIRFKLDVSGGFDQVIDFISSMQKFRYLSTYDSFSVTRSGTNGQLSTTGQIYFRQQ